MGFNLYSFMNGDIELNTGVTAFTGSTTWEVDSSWYSDVTLNMNTSGNIYAEARTQADIGGRDIIGQWAMVPEPSASPATLLLASMGLFYASRRRKKQLQPLKDKF